MAWERHVNVKYYYAGKRVGSVVKKIYLGRGRVAELASRFDAEVRRRRAASAATFDAEKARLHPAQVAADKLESIARLIADAGLLAAGYLQAAHGSWRRPRSWMAERRSAAQHQQVPIPTTQS
jgi:hypothetical protein